VNSAHIQADAVGGSEIANGSVGSSEIADGSILAADIAGGQVQRGHATFASRVVINGAEIGTPTVFGLSIVTGVPTSSAIADITVGISGFTSTPICTVTNRNEDATGVVVLSAAATSPTTLGVRVHRIDGFNTSALLDLSAICVGN
jgi:hypothetical protein